MSNKTEHEKKVESAIELFGSDIVHEVIMLVELSDPDGVYSMMEDIGKYEHAEAVSEIYF